MPPTRTCLFWSVASITFLFLKLQWDYADHHLYPSYVRNTHVSDVPIIPHHLPPLRHPFFGPRPYGPSPRPSLHEIVDGYNLTGGDPQWLLHFSIAGFPKCGTSTLMHYLDQNPELQMFRDERCELGTNQHAILMKDLYEQDQQGQRERQRSNTTTTTAAADTATSISNPPDFIRGIKCPRDLENTALALPNYGRYFPHTDMVVGIRHPVLWFESFYNHRVYNNFPVQPDTAQHIGHCHRKSVGVCTNRAAFHIYLKLLLKEGRGERKLGEASEHNGTTTTAAATTTTRQDDQTQMISEVEIDLMPRWSHRWMYRSQMHNWTGRVFLYDLEQLNNHDDDGGGGDSAVPRSSQFRADLQKFLVLRNPLPPIPWFQPGRLKDTEEEARKANAKKIDICDPQHREVRAKLMEHAINASTWIQQHMKPNYGKRKRKSGGARVVVSSPEYFYGTLMEKWKVDPCDTEEEQTRRRERRERQNNNSDNSGGIHTTEVRTCTRYGCFFNTTAAGHPVRRYRRKRRR